jgi:PEP-CTERM motif
MRKALFTLALLASALFLPRIAHADTIDDFVLTGGGNIITFSAPASFTVLNHPHLVSASLANVATSVNGLSGYSTNLTFYLNNEVGRGGLDFYLTSISGGGPDTYTNYTLTGPDVASLVIPNLEPQATVIFLPGTYSLPQFFNGIPQNTQGGITFSLTITPEAASTPEPSTFAMMATGILGAITTLRSRKSGVS